MGQLSARLSQQGAGSRLLPLRQGSLDMLCAIYSIINALRLAHARGAFKARIDAELVFRDIIEALDRKCWLRDIVFDGMDIRQVQFCLSTVKAYLWRRHRIKMHVTWPWKTKKSLRLTPSLKLLQRQLQDTNTVAIMGYTKARYSHWSVIEALDPETISLCDSLGTKPLKLSKLHFERHEILKDDMAYVMGPEDLIVLAFEEGSKAG